MCRIRLFVSNTCTFCPFIIGFMFDLRKQTIAGAPDWGQGQGRVPRVESVSLKDRGGDFGRCGGDPRQARRQGMVYCYRVWYMCASRVVHASIQFVRVELVWCCSREQFIFCQNSKIIQYDKKGLLTNYCLCIHQISKYDFHRVFFWLVSLSCFLFLQYVFLNISSGSVPRRCVRHLCLARVWRDWTGTHFHAFSLIRNLYWLEYACHIPYIFTQSILIEWL